MKNLIRKTICTLLCIGILEGQQSYSADTTDAVRIETIQIQIPCASAPTVPHYVKSSDDEFTVVVQKENVEIKTLSSQKHDENKRDTVSLSLPWYKNKKLWVGIATGAAVLTTATWAITKHFYGEEEHALPSSTLFSPSPFFNETSSQYLSSMLNNTTSAYGQSIAVSPYLEKIVSIFVRTAASTAVKKAMDYCVFYGGDYDQHLQGNNFDLACCTHTEGMAANDQSTTFRWMLNREWNCTNLNDDWSDVGCKSVDRSCVTAPENPVSESPPSTFETGTLEAESPEFDQDTSAINTLIPVSSASTGIPETFVLTSPASTLNTPQPTFAPPSTSQPTFVPPSTSQPTFVPLNTNTPLSSVPTSILDTSAIDTLVPLSSTTIPNTNAPVSSLPPLDTHISTFPVSTLVSNTPQPISFVPQNTNAPLSQVPTFDQDTSAIDTLVPLSSSPTFIPNTPQPMTPVLVNVPPASEHNTLVDDSSTGGSSPSSFNQATASQTTLDPISPELTLESLSPESILSTLDQDTSASNTLIPVSSATSLDTHTPVSPTSLFSLPSIVSNTLDPTFAPPRTPQPMDLAPPNTNEPMSSRNCTKYNEYLIKNPAVYEILRGTPCSSSYFEFSPTYNFDDTTLIALLTALQQLDLTGLKFTGFSIGVRGMTAFASALPTWNRLTSISFSNNGMGKNGANILAPALPSTLTTLRLDTNNIGADGATALSSALKNMKNLNLLYLYNNRIGDVGIAALALALNNNLYVLDLGQDDVGDVGLAALTPVLKNMSNLQSVDLRWNYGISANACLALKATVGEGVDVYCSTPLANQESPEPTSIPTTLIPKTFIPSPKPTSEIAHTAVSPEPTILRNCTKYYEYLLSNSVAFKLLKNTLCSSSSRVIIIDTGNDDIEAVFPALQQLDSNELRLIGFHIGMNAITAFASVLHTWEHLRAITFRDGYIGRDGLAVLFPAFPSYLNSFSLMHNNIGNLDIVALLSGWKNTNNLAELDLQNNHIGDAGVTSLIPVLKNMNKLQSVLLNGNSDISSLACFNLRTILGKGVTVTC